MPKRKDWSVAALNKALVDELCSGRHYLEIREKKKREAEIAAAQEARAMRGAKGKTMKFVGSIPQADYMEIGNALGFECWDDDSFVRDYFKRFPHLKSANL